jgi:hypothetical protein
MTSDGRHWVKTGGERVAQPERIYRRIAKAIRYANGLVTCIDERGNALDDYRGQYDDVVRKILSDAPDDCVFERFQWPEGFKKVTREEW